MEQLILFGIPLAKDNILPSNRNEETNLEETLADTLRNAVGLIPRAEL